MLVVLVLALLYQIGAEEQIIEDDLSYNVENEYQEDSERNLLLGTFVKFGGGLLSIAGQLGKFNFETISYKFDEIKFSYTC